MSCARSRHAGVDWLCALLQACCTFHRDEKEDYLIMAVHEHSSCFQFDFCSPDKRSCPVQLACGSERILSQHAEMQEDLYKQQCTCASVLVGPLTDSGQNRSMMIAALCACGWHKLKRSWLPNRPSAGRTTAMKQCCARAQPLDEHPQQRFKARMLTETHLPCIIWIRKHLTQGCLPDKAHTLCIPSMQWPGCLPLTSIML